MQELFHLLLTSDPWSQLASHLIMWTSGNQGYFTSPKRVHISLGSPGHARLGLFFNPSQSARQTEPDDKTTSQAWM